MQTDKLIYTHTHTTQTYKHQENYYSCSKSKLTQASFINTDSIIKSLEATRGNISVKSYAQILRHPGRGRSRCCIVDNWTCFSLCIIHNSKTNCCSSKRIATKTGYSWWWINCFTHFSSKNVKYCPVPASYFEDLLLFFVIYDSDPAHARNMSPNTSSVNYSRPTAPGSSYYI